MSTTLCTKCGQSCGEAEYIIHVANDCQTVRCPKCPQFYYNEESLLRHTRAVHDKEFSCTICQIEYASKYNLKRHMALTHKQIANDKFRCEECDEIYVTKYFLKRHIQRVHNREFVCTLCAEECVSIYTLRKHMRRRHPDAHVSIDGRKIFKVAKIECPKCGKQIAKPSLERHFRIKHSKSFTCHVCDRECPSEKALEKHIECRHGEEVSEEVLLKKRYKCPQCPRRFTAGWTLKTHIKGKHEQQFQCNVCDKFFSAPFPLMRHRMNIHGLNENDNETEQDSKTNEKDFDTNEDFDSDEDSEDSVDFPLASSETKTDVDEKDQKLTNEQSATFSVKK